ncbi:MAG: alpha-ketoacid dehydrogenase subunit beta [Chloroflexi bacterium]|nr:alpha-ketoacid dehydrogenase subunit beta [Chloroflexota bacterium]
MAVRTVLEAVRETLREEMHRDERVIVLGEDVGARGGVFRATEGLLKEFGEERVIDTPLAEGAIVGVAIGASLNGLWPVAEIQFADFIHPAFDQIVSEAARMRYRSNGAWGCPLVIRAPYGGGVHGALYHSQSVEAFFCHVPGLKVVAPATPYDTKGLLKASVRDEDPVIFLEHKRTYRLIKGEVPDDDYVLPLGKVDIKRAGEHISLITYGLAVHHALQAAEEVAREGISVEVVDLRTLKPLDTETVLASVRKTGKALVVHEDNLTGGFGAEIAAIIAQEAFEHLDGPVTRLAGPDVPAMPFSPPLEEAFIPGPEKIAAALRKLAAY